MAKDKLTKLQKVHKRHNIFLVNIIYDTIITIVPNILYYTPLFSISLLYKLIMITKYFRYIMYMLGISMCNLSAL